MRDRIGQIGRLGLCCLAQLPSPSPLSQVPFHPGLSMELCTRASGGSQSGAVDARVTWTQHSNNQSVWLAVISLACFVLLDTHKRTYTHSCEMSYTYVIDGLRMDAVFFPPHSNGVHFVHLILCITLCIAIHNVMINLKTFTTIFFILQRKLASAMSNLAHHAIHGNQLVMNV